jgi:hypothetical protein
MRAVLTSPPARYKQNLRSYCHHVDRTTFRSVLFWSSMFATVRRGEYLTRGKHRITKPLLYQLSYVGKRGQTLHRGNGVAITLHGLAPSLTHARAHDRDC